MFGSQALETAVGLALVFFVLASLASAIVEGISRLLRKRAKDLEETIGQMLSGSSTFDASAQRALDLFRGTAVYQAANVAAGRGRHWFRTELGPAYLSARSFANAVDELTGNEPLNSWLAGLKAEGRELTLDAKAAVEGWYDETMGRLSGAYKRWATAVLFVAGLVIAVAGNVSAFHTAQALWQQPAVREAALSAAEQAAAKAPSGDGLVGANVRTVQDLAGVGLPFGWEHAAHWSSVGWTASHVAGWLVTALLLMLGAPFWFDLLSRLVSLRSTGAKPPPASQDPAAATSLRTAVAGAPTAVLAPPAADPASKGAGG
ncbi:hypothetical protein Ade02nite_30420 [Paractinoplanes deccanensis]|uniref:Uncharacterized protein n=1 Tax=Paractinoplanes deccanensis TaxID=113561 RepID=A0ABQ3Y333_9ACTN|nr:hypothetical protein [Actinoplanes deccanensis]GID74401.1 hypothetical protein Ade02nite_30420 [Actinoplanes deccanensis]